MNLALSIILVLSSVLMIILVLLHKGKGSGLSDLFGGGISSTYGGSSVVEKNLDRITIVVGGVWFAACAAAGAGAAVARHSARLGRLAGALGFGLVHGLGRLCADFAHGQSQPDFGPDHGGRFCRSAFGVCRFGGGGFVFAAPGGARRVGPALAALGHAAGGGAAGVCGGAGQCFVGGFAGAGFAGRRG